MEQVVNIIVIRKNQLLVVRIREGDWWILPGGRIEKGESKETAI